MICVKCGGTDVRCKATINPNTRKILENIPYLRGYCCQCGSTLLVDQKQIKRMIESRYKCHIREKEHAPSGVSCYIFRKDKNDFDGAFIELSGTSRQIVKGLKSLAGVNNENFVLLECICFCI